MAPFDPNLTTQTPFADYTVRRTDRLFQIIEIIRSRRGSTTAQYLSERLEVSLRTIYRYIADLQNSGVAIVGEPGTGYRFAEGYSLPPLSFTPEELEALVFGIRLVERTADPALAEAARQALAKIDAVIPQAKRAHLDGTPMHAPDYLLDERSMARLGPMRRAIHARHYLNLSYRDQADQPSERKVRPLGLSFWGRTWTLVAWCELRDDFRVFRLDRMDVVRELPERFPDDPNRGFDAFQRLVNARRGANADAADNADEPPAAAPA